MVPPAVADFFAQHQNLLWIMTVFVDLGMTLTLFRFYGKQGLYAIIIFGIMLANLQGPKLTTVFGLETSLGMIIYSGIYFSTDVLSERYGRHEANRAVILGFLVSVLMILMISISLLFLPSTGDKREFAQEMHDAIGTLFNYGPRFVLGSLFAYLTSQSLDVHIFHYLKQKTNGRYLWLRNNGSTMTSQAVDTVVYAVVVWWGVVDLATAFQLAGAKYVLKVVIALLDTPFLYWAATWHPKDAPEYRHGMLVDPKTERF